MIRILDKDIEYLFPTEERMEKWFKDFNARFSITNSSNRNFVLVG